MTALSKLKGETLGTNFLHIASEAIQTDLLLRLCRILENKPRVCSIWHIKRTNEKLFNSLFSQDDKNSLDNFSEKIKQIRDKTLIHIDREVVNSKDIYEQANIRWREIRKNCSILSSGLNKLSNLLESPANKGDNYQGLDIPIAIKAINDFIIGHGQP